MFEWGRSEIMTEEMLRKEEALDREDEEHMKAYRESIRLRDLEEEEKGKRKP